MCCFKFVWWHDVEINNWGSYLVVWLSRNVNLASTSKADDTCGVCTEWYVLKAVQFYFCPTPFATSRHENEIFVCGPWTALNTQLTYFLFSSSKKGYKLCCMLLKFMLLCYIVIFCVTAGPTCILVLYHNPVWVIHLYLRAVSCVKQIYLNMNTLHCVLCKITCTSRFNTLITGLEMVAVILCFHIQ
jgi:hypothetical protein